MYIIFDRSYNYQAKFIYKNRELWLAELQFIRNYISIDT